MPPDLGIWNERASDPDWIVRLRAALDKAGHQHVTIVASDTSFDVCDGFAQNKTVADAIGIIGVRFNPSLAQPGPSLALPGVRSGPLPHHRPWQREEAAAGQLLRLGQAAVDKRGMEPRQG